MAYLKSSQTVHVLDLVAEGEIQGLTNGLQSVYLNGIPVIAPNGRNNHKGVSVAYRYGTPNQTAIPGVAGTEAEFTINAVVKSGNPVSTTITNDLVDRARVTLSVDQLYGQGKKGLYDKTVTFKIEVDPGTGVFKHAARTTKKSWSGVTISGNNTRTVLVDTSTGTSGLDCLVGWINPNTNTSFSETRYSTLTGTTTTVSPTLSGAAPDYLLEYKTTASGTWNTFSSGTFLEVPSTATEYAYCIRITDTSLALAAYNFRFSIVGGSADAVLYVSGDVEMAKIGGTTSVSIKNKRYKIVATTGIDSPPENTAYTTNIVAANI